MMKYRHIRILIALTLIFTLLGVYSTPAYAATCKGTTCEGLNPATMGCTGATSGTVKILPDGSQYR